VARDAGTDGSRTEREGWKEMETWGVEGEDTDSLFWHAIGRCVKA
jgi:hypothetical protein